MSKKEFAIADKDLSAEGVALYTDNSGKAENCLYVYGFTPENSFDFTDIETLRQNSSLCFLRRAVTPTAKFFPWVHSLGGIWKI